MNIIIEDLADFPPDVYPGESFIYKKWGIGIKEDSREWSQKVAESAARSIKSAFIRSELEDK